MHLHPQFFGNSSQIVKKEKVAFDFAQYMIFCLVKGFEFRAQNRSNHLSKIKKICKFDYETNQTN